MTYTISGIPIKSPDSFRIERYNMTKSGRLASGLMTMELIAKKRKFILKYDSLEGSELQQLLRLIDSDVMFFDFEYTEDGITKIANVYSGDIPTDLARDNYWKDVEIHLIER
jgi:hypothetical protein